MNASIAAVRASSAGAVRIGWVFAAKLILVAAVYVGSAKLGLALAFVNPSSTAIWPPTGIAIAANLIVGYWVWPAVYVGAFLANVTTAGSVATSFGVAAGNMLEGLVAAFLVNRFARGRSAFATPVGVLKFALIAAGVAPVVSASLGVASLSLAGYASWADFGAVWSTWWLGDASGALIVAPVLILWSLPSFARWSIVRKLEAGGVLLVAAATGLLVFGGLDGGPVSTYPLDFLCIPVLVWAAFRLDPRATATTTLVLSGLAVWGTWRGMGPFAGLSPNDSLLLLQLFMGLLAVTALALAAAVSALTEAEQQKEVFLSAAAHDLKSPLSVVKGLVQLMQRETSNGSPEIPIERGGLDRIDGAVGRMASLIDELLDMSRLEMRREFDLLLEPVDLVQLARRTVDDQRQLTDAHYLQLDAPGAPLVGQWDGLRLERALTNLLSNATKYSPEGGTVRVAIGALLEDGRKWATISVGDDGIGIPAPDLPYVFDRFRRGHNVRGSIRGTGIGLAYVREVVQRHHGRVWVESQEGQGTTCFVRLPVAAV